MPDLPGIRSGLPVTFDRLATSDDEVDRAVGLLKHAIRVAPFGRWWWSLFLPIVVVVIVVVLATSIIASVVMPVVAIIATTVIASVIAAVVTAIITSIPVTTTRIGPTITESRRSGRRLRLSKR
jgi:type IV secretory pathway VirB6-like protein